MLINFDFLFFFEKKNCEIAKNNDKQSEIFPKNPRAPRHKSPEHLP